MQPLAQPREAAFTTMKWIKTVNSTHQLLDDSGNILASLHRRYCGATVYIGHQKLRLHRRGFWRSLLVLTDAGGRELTVLQPAGWFSSTYRFRLHEQDYELVVRNNPLAEFVVQQEGQDLVAYGLKVVAGKVQTVITRTNRYPQNRYELDVLLWYLFAPVAQSETGSDEDFLVLIA